MNIDIWMAVSDMKLLELGTQSDSIRSQLSYVKSEPSGWLSVNCSMCMWWRENQCYALPNKNK